MNVTFKFRPGFSVDEGASRAGLRFGDGCGLGALLGVRAATRMRDGAMMQS